MRSFIYPLLFFVFLTSCQKTNGNETAADDMENLSAMNFRFELVGEVTDQLKIVRQINIFKGGNLHQTLEGFECEVQKNENVIIEDLNFDGYPDIRVLKFLPATPNIPYFYWIFNPKTKQFDRNEALEIITSPALDTTNQLILSQWVESEEVVGTDFYRFVGDELRLVRRETQNYIEPNVYILTVQEKMGDSLKTVKTERIEEEDVIY